MADPESIDTQDSAAAAEPHQTQAQTKVDDTAVAEKPHQTQAQSKVDDTDAAAEPHQTQTQSKVDDTAAKLNNLTLRIWPPTQRTRDAVINRLVETLSSQSVLSKRYGTIPEDEASAAAKSIEEQAFSVAGASFSADDDGIEILQVYSKEISKRMLDTVKSRAAAAAAAPSDSAEVESSNGGAAGGEEISSSSVKAEA